MISKDEADEALRNLLFELPAEFSHEPTGYSRPEFRVIKERNVNRVHESLWILQQYFKEQ